MTQTIEQLTARVRELEEELDAAYKAVDDNWVSHQQLVASQAYAEQLREAFKTVATGYEIGSAVSANNDHTIKLHYADQQQMEDAFDALILQLDKALAFHNDTSALDAYVAEKVKELEAELTAAYKSIDDNWTSHQKIVEANRQRDLAVEALIGIENFAVQPWAGMATEALLSIKESDGK